MTGAFTGSISQDTASASTSCMATRVGLRLRASTRGLCPFWSCFARWAATVMKRNLLSTFFGRIRCVISSDLLARGKRPEDFRRERLHAAGAAPRRADHGFEALDALVEV